MITQRNTRVYRLEDLPALIAMALILLFWCLTMVGSFSFGKYSLERLPQGLAFGFVFAVAAKWLFYRIWFHPRQPVRFACLVFAANAIAFPVVVWVHAALPLAHLIMAGVAMWEYGLYKKTASRTGLSERFGEWEASRARWTIVYGNLLVPFLLHFFLLCTCLEPDPRPRVSRAKADMRSLATGLECYIVDHNTPPDALNRLTTPIAYVVPWHRPETDHGGVARDPFCDPEHPTDFAYFATGTGSARPNDWIVWSVGPDGDNDLEPYALRGFFAPSGVTEETIETLKIHYTYDPTNGSYSSGDIWRVRDPAGGFFR